MRVLSQTNDPVAISFAQALLSDAGIELLVLDGYTSLMEGSFGAIPRRLAVADADFAQARSLLRAAGLAIVED